MFEFFSNMFGYVLNGIYILVKNYGVAIILFSIIIKFLMLPMSIKQQKTMKKTEKIQKEMNKIQDKYKNNPEKMNMEIMDLYKRENMSPFSGCFSLIIQMVLLFAMFYLVRSPLTYMKKIDTSVIEQYSQTIKEEKGEEALNGAYPEMAIIKYATEKNLNDSEIYVNMDFLGVDLSDVPTTSGTNYTSYIIPALYVISSILSIRLTANMNNSKKDKNDVIEIKNENQEENKKDDMQDMTKQMNKSMTWMMPILSVSVALVAPLGLALYWLINNILMIIERIIIDKFITKKEEKENA